MICGGSAADLRGREIRVSRANDTEHGCVRYGLGGGVRTTILSYVSRGETVLRVRADGVTRARAFDCSGDGDGDAKL